MFDYEGTRREKRRDAVIAGAMLLLALFFLLAPAWVQGSVRTGLRRSLLRPFLALQVQVARRRSQMVQLADVTEQRDSLAALVAAQASLWEENRRLRALLTLSQRLGDTFIPAEVLRPGTARQEGTFLLSVGAADGVGVGSPVITPEGLLGVVKEVDAHTAQAIDWTHAFFRAAAMTEDGKAYGIVEPREGRFHEEDLLVLRGAPFHSEVRPGKRIVTSGWGGVYPRGVPVGTVVGIEEADTGWRKSYVLRPAVRPEAVGHVLVGTGPRAGADLSIYWDGATVPDTGAVGASGTGVPAPTPGPGGGGGR